MADELGKLAGDFTKDIENHGLKLPDFSGEYDAWYSAALRTIKQLVPDRFEDFTQLYKNEKRKQIDFLTYSISDYLLGLKTEKYGEVVVDKSAALPKMQMQRSILKSTAACFESSLFEIQAILQADLFDSEIDGARELAKNGFYRASGAVTGVILEKHLRQVCTNHNLPSRKPHPCISDYYQLLKEAQIIDVPKWRFIQHLADIRNLCDHGKDREPTKEDAMELAEGVEKVIKTVF